MGPADVIAAFLEICFYQPGEYSLSCGTEGPLVFGKLADTIAEHEQRLCGPRVVGTYWRILLATASEP
jgi:hypothetical protein